MKIWVGIALAAIGFITGLFYCTHLNGTPSFYQKWFGPAVMFASGRGFINPDPTCAPALKDFLETRRQSLDPAEIPGDIPVRGLSLFHRATRYLLLTVGLWWRIVGISWPAVAPINASLYAIATVSFYAIFRLAFTAGPAAALALFMCFSPVQLEMLPALRDYSKAPFILGAIAILGHIVLKSPSRRNLLLLSVLGGCILGIGAGFRNDIEGFVPILIVMFLLFYGSRPWHELRSKAAAVGLIVLAYAVSAAPIHLDRASAGTNVSHVVLLGFTAPFDEALDIRPSVYDLGPFYNDEYVASTVGSYAERMHSYSPRMLTADYDPMVRLYIGELVRRFPADLLTRFWASVIGVLEFPFTYFPPYNLDPAIPYHQTLDRVFTVLGLLRGYGVFLMCFLLAAAALRGLRYGFFTIFLVLILAGYPFLQFSTRHFFHLQFISVLTLSFAAAAACSLAARPLRSLPAMWSASRRKAAAEPHRGIREGTRPSLLCRIPPAPSSFSSLKTAVIRLSTIAVVSVVLIALPMWALRRYQSQGLTRLFDSYISAVKKDVEFALTPRSDGTVFIHWKDFAVRTTNGGNYLTDYYLMEFKCAEPVAVTELSLKYDHPFVYAPHARLLRVVLRKGVNRIFFPVYGTRFVDTARWQFLGIETSRELVPKIAGFYRLVNLNDKPLLLDLALPAGWERDTLYQTLRLEHPRHDGPSIYAARLSENVMDWSWVTNPASVQAEPDRPRASHIYSSMVKFDMGRVLVDGRVRSRLSYLARFEKVTLTKGSFLVAAGRVDEGGLDLGVLKDGAWHNQIVVDEPGEFLAAVEIGADGEYEPILANATSGDFDRNRFVLTRFGILRPAEADKAAVGSPQDP